jgi:hypothetical protein
VAVEVFVNLNMLRVGLCVPCVHITHHQAQFCLKTKALSSDEVNFWKLNIGRTRLTDVQIMNNIPLKFHLNCTNRTSMHRV